MNRKEWKFYWKTARTFNQLKLIFELSPITIDFQQLAKEDKFITALTTLILRNHPNKEILK